MTVSPRASRAAHRDGMVAPAIQALLLEDVLPRAHRALVIGAHDHAAISLICRNVREVTLVHPDAEMASHPTNCTILSSLDAVATSGAWDVVVALQEPGTANLPSSTSPWGTLDQALAHLAPGGTALVVLRNPNPLVDLIGTETTSPARSGQEVISAPRLADRLASFRKGPVTTYSLFGQLDTTMALRDDVSQTTGAGHWPTDLAARASGTNPAVAGRLAASGLTWTLAAGWIGVVGGQGAPIYTRSQDQGWARAHSSVESGEWTVTAAESVSAGVTIGPDIRAEDALRQAMLDSDYLTFRAVARALGELSRSQSHTGPLDFRTVYVGGAGASGPTAHDDSYMTEDAQVDPDRAARAGDTDLPQSWRDFDERVATVRAPWDETLSPSARLTQRLLLSGADATALLGDTSQFEDADAGVVAALRSAVARRDAQLRRREEYIRGLRRQWTDLQLRLDGCERELAGVTSSPAYRRAQRHEVIRSPRKLARALASRGASTARRVVGVARSRS